MEEVSGNLPMASRTLTEEFILKGYIKGVLPNKKPLVTANFPVIQRVLNKHYKEELGDFVVTSTKDLFEVLRLLGLPLLKRRQYKQKERAKFLKLGVKSLAEASKLLTTGEERQLERQQIRLEEKARQHMERQKIRNREANKNLDQVASALSVVDKQYASQPLTSAWVNSTDFLQSPEWKRVRYAALTRDGGRCACCGASAKDGVRLCVDHILPRKTHPWLALTLSNLQILCEHCNCGKGNVDRTDWR